MNSEKIDELAEFFPIQTICDTLEVSRSAFYERKNKAERGEVKPRRKADTEHAIVIRWLFFKYRGVYGRPRLMRELRKHGIRMSEKRLARLMREEGLAAKRRRRFRKTTDSEHDCPIAPNILERNFTVDEPNRVWCSDITYIRTHQGWMYLCVVMDLFSRKIVGWSLADHMRTSMVLEALEMAVGLRRPPEGLIFHSDRGVQYASSDFRAELQAHKMIQSMSRAGECWDNAVVESWNDKLKQEMVHRTVFETKESVEMPVFDYIECFYNQKRIHTSNNYQSPNEYEELFLARREAAS